MTVPSGNASATVKVRLTQPALKAAGVAGASSKVTAPAAGGRTTCPHAPSETPAVEVHTSTVSTPPVSVTLPYTPNASVGTTPLAPTPIAAVSRVTAGGVESTRNFNGWLAVACWPNTSRAPSVTFRMVPSLPLTVHGQVHCPPRGSGS